VRWVTDVTDLLAGPIKLLYDVVEKKWLPSRRDFLTLIKLDGAWKGDRPGLSSVRAMSPRSIPPGALSGRERHSSIIKREEPS
jgi:hypothetical protein